MVLITGSPDHIEVGKSLLYSPVHGPAPKENKIILPRFFSLRNNVTKTSRTRQVRL
jgi:hypothetical protein